MLRFWNENQHIFLAAAPPLQSPADIPAEKLSKIEGMLTCGFGNANNSMFAGHISHHIRAGGIRRRRCKIDDRTPT
jgi:hypothetical protein